MNVCSKLSVMIYIYACLLIAMQIQTRAQDSLGCFGVLVVSLGVRYGSSAAYVMKKPPYSIEALYSRYN